MTSKNQITKYYKVNICDNQDDLKYKCYKIIKEKEGKTTVINYTLDSTIRELKRLRAENIRGDDMNPFFNFIRIGIISIVLLKFYREFFF